MPRNRTNRFRISSAFLALKLMIGLLALSIVISVGSNIYDGTFTLKLLPGLALQAALISCAVFFISTRKQIDYDVVLQELYIVDAKKQEEVVVPIAAIVEILYSSVGLKNEGSYIIIYRDQNNKPAKVRLFPIPFDKTIHTFIADAKHNNPAVITTGLNTGWLGFFLRK